MAWRSILEKHPEHVRLIGMIAIESGNLEIALATLFARMLWIPLRIGRATYLTPQAAHARLEILRNAAKAEFDRSTKSATLRAQYIERVTKIIVRVSDAINKRNRIVHDSWGYNDDDREVSRLMIDGNPDRDSVSVPILELENQLKAVRNLIDDVNALAREFYRNPPAMVDMRLSESQLQSSDTRTPNSRPDPPRTARRRRSSPA
jgi:hypothetical protein